MRALVYRFPRLLLIAGWLALLTHGAMAVPARGQNADDAAEADKPAKPDEGDAMPADDDFAAGDDAAAEIPKPAAPRAKATKKPGEEAELGMSNEPAVQAVLESHPKTPRELLRAIDILVDLGHAPLAKAFADELGQRKLDLAAKAALADQFNSATLLKLAADRELAPVLGGFIDDLLRSAEAYRHEPKRLAAWARQLSDANESVRAKPP